MSLPTPTNAPQPSAPILTFSERVGLIFITEASLLSGIAVIIVLAYIAFKACQLRSYRTSGDSADIHNYFLSLMVAELVQAVGWVMSAKWVTTAQVLEGTLCVAQGILQQIGEVGVALTCLAIAVHTFCVLGLRWRAPAIVSYIVITLIWLFLFLVVIISWAIHRSSENPYYGPAGKWCWIGKGYNGQRIGLEYFWLWFTAIMDIVIYIFLALVMWGFIVIEPGRRPYFRNKLERRDDRALVGAEEEREAQRVARSLLFYPLVYTLCVFPQSISRWLYFTTGKEAPFAAVVVCSIIFQLSGVFNVLLFMWTRPKAIAKTRSDTESLAGDAEKPSNGTGPSHSYTRTTPRTGYPEGCSCGAPSSSGAGRLGDDESGDGFRFDDNRQSSRY